MSKKMLSALVILGVVGSLWWGIRPSKTEPLSHQSNETVQNVKNESQQRAPNFPLERLQGGTIDVVQKGKPTIINFWASWCGPCKVELPMLQQAFEKYQDRFAFRMVNVTVDDDKERVKSFIDKKGYTFPVLFDSTGEASEIYQIFSIPTTYFIDEHGNIHKKVMGAMNQKQFEAILSGMLSST